MYFPFLAVAIVATVVRAIAIYYNRNLYRLGFAGDSSIHFTIIRQLKMDSRSRFIDQYLIRYEPMSYPTAYHRYCGLFPLKLIETYPWIPNLVLFVASAVGFAVYFQYVSVALIGLGTPTATAVAAGAFILLPGQYVFRGPGLAYISLSERLLARISTGAFIASSVVASHFHDEPSLILAVGAGAVGLLTSLFSRQALIFTTPVMALLLWSWWPLLAFLLGLTTALVLSRSYFVLSMKHTIQQWSLYASHTKRSAVIRANLVRLAKSSDLRDAHSLRGVVWRLLQYEPARSMLHCPEVLLSLVLLVISRSLGGSIAGMSVWLLAVPVLASLLVFLVTATESFNHLGECYRYLEYGLYFVAPMIFGVFAIEYPAFAWWELVALIFASLPSLYLVYVMFASTSLWAGPDLMQDVIQGMNLPQDAVVFPVGMPVAADVCARRPDVKSFWYQPGLISKAIYADFIEGWPFLKLDAGGIIEKFQVTHAIVDKGYLQYLPAPCRLASMQLVYENDRYVGYRRAPVSSEAGTVTDDVVLERPFPIASQSLAAGG